MAVMWAFPFSIIVALIASFFWREVLLPLVLLTWILPLLIFMLFPLILATIQRVVQDWEGDYVFCNTDSMCICDPQRGIACSTCFLMGKLPTESFPSMGLA